MTNDLTNDSCLLAAPAPEANHMDHSYLRIFIGQISLALFVITVTTVPVCAQNGHPIDWNKYQDMAVKLMQQYLQINTSNPPGNEVAAAKFFKTIFDQHGIQNEIFEYKPGRANIIARLKGSGTKRP